MDYKKNPVLTIITIMDSTMDIKEFAKSLAAQEWKDYEWILFAHNIKDKKEFNELISPYASYITKLTFVHGTQSDTLLKNTALYNSKGEFILFLNNGCKLENNILEKIFKDKKYSESVLYGDLNEIKNNKIEYIKFADKIEKGYFISSILDSNTVFLHRSLFSIYGQLNKKYKFYNIQEKLITACNNNKEFLHLNFPVVIKKASVTDKVTKKLKRIELTDLIYAKYTNEQINSYYNFNKSILLKIFSLTREAGIKVMWFCGLKVFFRSDNLMT